MASSHEETAAETRARTSRDLAHDLQFRTLEQLTNLGVGGAGVTITLIGGVLRNLGPFVWIATVEFGITAFAALLGQVDLTNNVLLNKEPTRTRNYTMVAVFFLAMGVGSLATSVFLSR
jgi:hypothetical protein